MRMSYRIMLLVSVLLLSAARVAAGPGDGDGAVTISGELKQWHKVTLTINGPFARETDTDPNPFTDYRLEVTFTHASGSPSHTVPGYFAADGRASETSASEGNKWRAHLSPDKSGRWNYVVAMVRYKNAHLVDSINDFENRRSIRVQPVDGKEGSFTVAESDKTGHDLRAHGRLEYVGKRYLRFAASGEYFLKAGADAPETLLAYADFDGTTAHKQNAPLKTYTPHLADWREGDPVWQGDKGKGLVGAINYLASTGCNAFSFLPYNAGGDGDNVWPFVTRDDKFHYDCSKLDQWQVVFDHATTRGMYLHFKLQETENDDNRHGRNKDGKVAASLDGGDLGTERRLYLRELVARFGYLLALNWNLGEENTQSTEQQRAMARYLREIDPYHHHIVIHTYPNQQDQVYGPLLGDRSVLTGASLQNSNVRDCHEQVRKWVRRSEEAGKPWVVAFDEPGDASYGQPPDPDYPGMDKIERVPLTIDDVRTHALWGTLMAGGAGVEYYFGYKLPQNDLNCEDWRSRDQSWRYCAIALAFFHDNKLPFWDMQCRDDLLLDEPKPAGGEDFVGVNATQFCFAKPGEVYVVYTARPDYVGIDLTNDKSSYDLFWFNPRSGGKLIPTRRVVQGGGKIEIPSPLQMDPEGDWVYLLRKKKQ